MTGLLRHLLSLCLLPQLLSAATPSQCTDANTKEFDCLQALIDQSLGASTAVDAARSTSGSTGGKPFSPTLTTFTQFLAGGLDFLTMHSTDRDISLETPSLGFGGPVRAKGQLDVIQPTLSSTALGTIADLTKRATAQSGLTAELGDFDDWRAAVSLGVGANRAALVARLLSSIRADAKGRAALVTGLQALKPQHIDTDKLMSEAPAGTLAELQRLADALAAFLTADRGATKALRDALSPLLANDSLFVADVAYESRAPLVGRDEFSLMAGYEWGFWTLSDFVRDSTTQSGVCDKTDSASIDTCLSEFIEWEKKNHAAIASAFRLSASVTYVTDKAYTLSRPDYGIVLNLPNAHSISWAVKGGMSFGPGAKPPIRCDIGLAYEDNSSDPAKRDRMVGNVTVVVRVSDTLQVPLGLEYANHAQYLADADKRWGAHFGPTFRQ